MTPEQTLVASTVHAWKQQIDRADKLFAGFSDDQLNGEIAPGKNRLVYLLGHLVAVHDGMLPLLGLGARLHPELDSTFLTAPDRAAETMPSAAELRRMWQEVNRKVLAGLESFSAAEWIQRHAAVNETDFAANPLRNRLAILLSRTAHVAYHLGQAQLAAKQTN
jgi:hypothetical protein